MRDEGTIEVAQSPTMAQTSIPELKEINSRPGYGYGSFHVASYDPRVRRGVYHADIVGTLARVQESNGNGIHAVVREAYRHHIYNHMDPAIFERK